MDLCIDCQFGYLRPNGDIAAIVWLGILAGYQYRWSDTNELREWDHCNHFVLDHSGSVTVSDSTTFPTGKRGGFRGFHLKI